MDLFLYSALVVLIILSFLDLVVGVSNDAVNFLNSAIGSKVGSFKTIMMVATAGILIGALSSAGMMEIAREGIFNPEYFNFYDVIIIFLAVMLTDVVLLDAFNTLGLPTSTTVSLIFELLGASIMVSVFKIMEANDPLNWLFNINNPSEGIIGYINWSKTSTIVSSILLSVIIAFSTGIFIMFISRMLFSFHYNKRIKYIGVIWVSIAMVAISYFMVFKGLKSTYSTKELTKSELINYTLAINPKADTTSFNSDNINIKDISGNEMAFTSKINSKGDKVYESFYGLKSIKQVIKTVQDNLPAFLGGFFIFFLILFSILNSMGINILKLLVYVGTFTLAMAFAGNDLVNFIGVPLAGIQSYDLYSSANAIMDGSINPDAYNMIGLKFPMQAPYLYLLLAGVIMILTLWFSTKARTVTETEVKLGSQEEVKEKFKSNMISRNIVQFSVYLSSELKNALPNKLQVFINNQFKPIEDTNIMDAPAFDLIRASVNLTTASMLIALGTSLKLPLSTTYVTFMVAMGTSLADRAWGRESASYRIAGVINVILGWFLTALIALTISAFIAMILIKFKLYGLVAILLFFGGSLLYSTLHHRKEQNKKAKSEQALNSIDLNTEVAFQETAKSISRSISSITNSYILSINGLIEEDLVKIGNAKKITDELMVYYGDIKSNLFKAIKKSQLTEKQTAQLYILSNDLMLDILESLSTINQVCDAHIKNAHKPLKANQIDAFVRLKAEMDDYLTSISKQLNRYDFEFYDNIKKTKRSIFDHIEAALSQQVEGVVSKDFGFKNTDINLTILLETKDLVAIAMRFSKLIHRLSNNESPLGTRQQ
ncbi:MAG: inorganic phosphate transporter [Saprospiraceae bacterium]